jgi:hypothetical protein
LCVVLFVDKVAAERQARVGTAGLFVCFAGEKKKEE